MVDFSHVLMIIWPWLYNCYPAHTPNRSFPFPLWSKPADADHGTQPWVDLVGINNPNWTTAKTLHCAVPIASRFSAESRNNQLVILISLIRGNYLWHIFDSPYVWLSSFPACSSEEFFILQSSEYEIQFGLSKMQLCRLCSMCPTFT